MSDIKQLFHLAMKVISAVLCLSQSTGIAKPLQESELNTPFTQIVNLQLPPNWYLGEVAGLEFLPSGELVVFNRGAHPLMIFDHSGQFVREIGLGLFKVPHGLHVDKYGYIWTADQETHQVFRFDSYGKIKLILGRKNSPGQGWFDNGYQLNLLKEPSDVVLDSHDNIYVADAGNFRIVKFDQHGNLLQTWGVKGDQPGQFNFPHTLLIDASDRLYIADRQNGRLQVFDSDGRFYRTINNIGYPYEIEWYDEKRIILTDARSGEINLIDTTGKIVRKFGRWGKARGEFGFPHGLAVAKDGWIYVGELLNWRIQKFKY